MRHTLQMPEVSQNLFSTMVHVSPAGIPDSQIYGKVQRDLDLDHPQNTPPPDPLPPTPPWQPSCSCTAQSQLGASLVTMERDISVLSLKWLLPHLLTVPASHSLPPPSPEQCLMSSPPRPHSPLQTELYLALEDKFCFLLLTLFLWNTPSLHFPLPSLCFHSTLSLLHFSPHGPSTPHPHCPSDPDFFLFFFAQQLHSY